MPILPFKLNQHRRGHIPEQTHTVMNWRAYDASLRQRDSLTVWFTADAIEGWRAEPCTTPGGQPWYSPLAILTGLTLRAVFHLALCQAEGLIGSVIGLLGLALSVPDHSTLSRRAETLAVPRPQPRGDGKPLQPAGGQHRPEALRRWRVAGREARRQDAPVLAQAAHWLGCRHRPGRRSNTDHEGDG